MEPSGDGSRVMAGSKFYAPILPPAQAVLKKYNFHLPIITNQKLNDYLEVIREKLDINKSMTCHVGRHSFATLLLNHGFSIEKTARALGHKDIKTTQVYAKILKSSMVPPELFSSVYVTALPISPHSRNMHGPR